MAWLVGKVAQVGILDVNKLSAASAAPELDALPQLGATSAAPELDVVPQLGAAFAVACAVPS
eukprot:scaffold28436_cov18-Tisochrysis_lutea.AAC.3